VNRSNPQTAATLDFLNSGGATVLSKTVQFTCWTEVLVRPLFNAASVPLPAGSGTVNASATSTLVGLLQDNIGTTAINATLMTNTGAALSTTLNDH
jgi:hypothetical protein